MNVVAIEKLPSHLHLVESVNDKTTLGASNWNRGAFVMETTAEGEAVRVLGEVDMANAQDFEETIARAARITGSVVVDFNRCTYFDSSALSVLARMNRVLGDDLHVVAPTGGFAQRLFELTHFTRLLNVKFESPLEIRDRLIRDDGYPQERYLK